MRDVPLELILLDQLMSAHVLLIHHFHVHLVVIVTEYLIVQVTHSTSFIHTSLLLNHYW